MKMHGRLRLLLGLVTVAGLTATSLLYADAFAVPRSNLVIEGMVRLSNGFTAHFYSREGTMLSVRDFEAGRWYGFVPVINPETRTPNFSASLIIPLPEGGERVVEVNSGEDIEVRPKSERGHQQNGRDTWNKFVIQGELVEIQVLSVRPGKFSKVVLVDPRSKKPSELQKLYGTVGGGLCVLSCGGITVGANSVEMECGSCQGEGIDF